ncbi:MAG: hypothetical protein HY644_10295 [Acidobacteria bacterium]|nr:hypothetical protein [Acidobacteriota bacterium]
MTRRILLLVLLVLLPVGLVFVGPWLQAALLLLDAGNFHGLARQLVRWTSQEVHTQNVHVLTRYGGIRGRIYAPSNSNIGAVVLVHGVHAAGIAEERLGPFARKLAAHGLVVLTPEMEELRRYRITSETTDKIEDSVRWFIEQKPWARHARVGLIGISFSGGLSIVAAGRSSIRDRISFTLSLGGHGELYRTSYYLCTGRLAEGRGYFKPHDYAVGILLFNLCDRLVPPGQSGPLADAVAAYLAEDYERGRRMIGELPPPASRILSWVDARDLGKIGPLMLPEIGHFASDPNLSPERSAPPATPVFLLHGREDNLIPAFETEALARYLRKKAEVHFLVTPLISHVELERPPGVRDVWNLLRFWEKIFWILDRARLAGIFS